MIKVKKILCILVILIIVVSCVSYASAKAEFVIKFSTANAPFEPMAQAFEQYFKPVVEEKSNGRIEVQIFTSGALGGERDVVEGLRLGTIEMTAVAYGIVTNFVPKMELFLLPYLFESKEHCYAVLDSELGMGFAKDLAEHGFILLTYCDFGLRNILTTKKAINSMSDLKGLKIRLQEVPINIESFKAFGANPVAMSYGEVYTGMQTGVIDGMEAADTNYYSQKFYEVAPNYAVVNWTVCSAPVLVSKVFFDSMPADLQKLVSDTAKETAILEREMYTKDCAEKFELIKKEGVNVTYPDLEPFREASKVVYNKWADQVGGIEKINQVINFKY